MHMEVRAVAAAFHRLSWSRSCGHIAGHTRCLLYQKIVFQKHFERHIIPKFSLKIVSSMPQIKGINENPNQNIHSVHICHTPSN